MLIYDVLKKDHDKVLEYLNELVLLDRDDGERRHELIDQIRDELIPHARAEESILYNSLRSFDSAKDFIMHSYQEHIAAETSLRLLQLKDKLDVDWTRTAQKLKKDIQMHIQEEELRIFSVARQLFTHAEGEMMAEAFEQLKPEVRGEGFAETTLELIANMMPPRFANTMRKYNLESRL